MILTNVSFKDFDNMTIVLDLLLSSSIYNSMVFMKMPSNCKEWVGGSERTPMWKFKLPFNIAPECGVILIYNAIKQEFPEIDSLDALAFAKSSVHDTEITDRTPYGWTASIPKLKDVDDIKVRLYRDLAA